MRSKGVIHADSEVLVPFFDVDSLNIVCGSSSGRRRRARGTNRRTRSSLRKVVCPGDERTA